MTLDQNDWRLTAYALNELDDADRAEVEAAIADSPELARTIDEIRATVGVLQTALADEMDSPIAKGGHRGVGGPRRGSIRRLFIPLAAAASIVLAVGIGWLTLAPGLSRSPELVSLATGDAKRINALGYLGGQTPRAAAPQAPASDGRTQNGSSSAGSTSAPRERQALIEEEKEIRKSIERAIDQGTPVPPELIARLRSVAGETGEVHRLTSRDRQQQVQMQLQRAPEGSASLLIGSREGFEKLAALGYLPKVESTGFDQVVPAADWFLSASTSSGMAQIDTINGHPYVPICQSMAGNPTQAHMLRVANISSDEIDRLIEQLASPESPGFEDYRAIQENPFRLVENDPLSTFSIDVDTASYANIRRWLTGGSVPPPDAVRIEEMINYFDYAYPQPVDEHPFAVHVEVAQCPWNGAHRLARIGIKGYEIAPQDRPPANLVFLIDVSGSMQPANKLPLLREALSLMIDELHRDDYVGIVVYAGASGIVLSPTNNKDVIRSSLSGLMAGGGTNGAAGIEAAYQLAEDTFVPGGINRVILATDGDFNVGVTGSGDLQRLIEEKAKSGVFLTVLGFGMGNLKDGTLETLADKGNGNYAYIDTLSEAQKVLIEQMEGTLVTIAKDVKIQVEFNPLAASAYRLIGYENRMLAAQDFNDDKKDAGEIGAGHTVTALYEIVPAGQDVDVPPVDALKYQTVTEFTPAADSGELMTVKLRYKEPDGEESKLIEMPVADSGATFAESSDDFAFAASVAAFGMLLRHSEHAGSMTFAAVAEFAEGAMGQDFYGYRAEFIDLVRKAESIATVP